MKENEGVLTDDIVTAVYMDPASDNILKRHFLFTVGLGTQLITIARKDLPKTYVVFKNTQIPINKIPEEYIKIDVKFKKGDKVWFKEGEGSYGKKLESDKQDMNLGNSLASYRYIQNLIDTSSSGRARAALRGLR